MHWKRPKLGKKRKRGHFLLLPKKIGNEVRWLEWAAWEEQCVVDVGLSLRRNRWFPVRWLDEAIVSQGKQADREPTGGSAN